MILFKNRAQAIMYDFAYANFDRIRKVIIPANVCASVPLTYKKMNIPYEAVDIDINTLSLDIEKIENMLLSSSKIYQAIHYVCGYGNISDKSIERLLELKCKYNVKIILDKCLCMPDIDFCRKTFADIELYSTGYSKCIDIGGGGYAILKDIYENKIVSKKLPFSKEDYSKMKLLEKQNEWNNIASLDWLESYDLQDIDAYISQIRMRYDDVIKHKKRLNEIYRSIIPTEFLMPDKFNIWRFNIRLSNAEYVQNKIFEHNGLFVSRHYKPVFQDGTVIEKFPNAERIYAQIMNLFNDFHYDDIKAEKTASIIKEYGILYE